MALLVNQSAPDFTLPSTAGGNFNLRHDWPQQGGILYFYPKNFTSVCTKEACEFRDEFSAFRDLNITVVGISQDSLDSHQKFKETYQLPFELLADRDGQVSRLYRARIPFLKVTKRVTYLLDQDHRVAAVYEDMFRASRHVRSMVEAIR